MRFSAAKLMVAAYLHGVREFLPLAQQGGVLSLLDNSDVDSNADWLGSELADHYTYGLFPLRWDEAAPYARRILEAFDAEGSSRNEREVFCTCVSAALYLTFAKPLTSHRQLAINVVLHRWRRHRVPGVSRTPAKDEGLTVIDVQP